MKPGRWFCGIVLAGIAGTAFAAAPPPISVFAQLGEMRGVTISPDGRYLAFITQSQSRPLVETVDLHSKDKTPRPVLTTDSDGKFDMGWCRWAKVKRLLCGYVAPVEEMGVTYRITKLVAVNADGSAVKVLMQNSTAASGSQLQDRVLDYLLDDPDNVLIQAQENLSQTSAWTSLTPAVWKLNIFNGRMKRIERARESFWGYYSDNHGHIRLATGRDHDAVTYWARLKDSNDWRKLANVDSFTPLRAYIPESIIAGTNKAYAIGPGPKGNRNALWLIDLEDKASPQLLFDHPVADIENPIVDDDGRLIGVTYETDRPYVHYTDGKVSAIIDAVNKVLPNMLNVAVSRSRDKVKYIIRSMSDRVAGVFYLFDTATGQLARLGSVYPELANVDLPRMRAIEYPARDGTKIPGYLTVPVGDRADNLPLIVMPHGGPIERDSWGFDFLRLFLATRGYAVLQMNFRGSGGYGFDWQFAAHQDWGGLTYSDIVDGTKWAIAKGIADPKRVCIVGWSFGGYAALTGAVRNGDLYKCAVSIAGVSDLSELIENELKFVGGHVAWEQIGTDRDKLKENSPVRHAADVNIPVLMFHGTLDAQSPYKQSEEMAHALDKAGKNYKFVTIKDADHNLWRESERTTLLTDIEKFLQANIGQDAQLSAN